MGFDTAYESIVTISGDERWAFGTGFADPLAGADAPVPEGVDGADLAAYCLMLADDALVASHRLQEWLTRAPELEEETALANIALDLLGQSRLLYGRAGRADGTGRGEDDYAFFRSEQEFRNVTFVEAVDDDFAGVVVRLTFFTTWRLALATGLAESRDPVLAAIAAKAVKELTYHRGWSARWVVTLGIGTPCSRERVSASLEVVAPAVPELYRASDVERRLVASGVAVDPGSTRAEVESVVAQIMEETGLAWPALSVAAGPRGSGRGRDAIHSAAMAPLLAELQGLARAHPGAVW